MAVKENFQKSNIDNGIIIAVTVVGVLISVALAASAIIIRQKKLKCTCTCYHKANISEEIPEYATNVQLRSTATPPPPLTLPPPQMPGTSLETDTMSGPDVVRNPAYGQRTPPSLDMQNNPAYEQL